MQRVFTIFIQQTYDSSSRKTAIWSALTDPDGHLNYQSRCTLLEVGVAICKSSLCSSGVPLVTQIEFMMRLVIATLTCLWSYL